MVRAKPRVRDFSTDPDDPTPTVLQSEWSIEEIAERYIDQQQARAAEIRKQARRDGDGDQAATPALPDDEPDEAHSRRKPGAR